MRRVPMVAVMSGAILAGFASAVAAFERTAYILNDDTGSLVSVDLPVSPPNPPGYVQPTPIASFGWLPAGSALHPDGRILTLNWVADELVAITPETGELEVLCTLSQDVTYLSDLFWGVDGRLRLYRSYGSLADLDLLDLDTCELTPEAVISGDFESIENHQGHYYATISGSFWRIDPQTYEGTLIIDLGVNTHFWGLASVGTNLWRGYSYRSPGNFDDPAVELVDPTTGSGEPWVFLPYGYYSNCALQVIEQPGPPSVPAVTRGGILVLVLGLGAAGLAALRVR